uniref:Uncharacterized protein n=1 Tax=Rhizophora mucronata TaxID=61149 RepID=A0A2P2N7R2_RHIMU
MSSDHVFSSFSPFLVLSFSPYVSTK